MGRWCQRSNGIACTTPSCYALRLCGYVASKQSVARGASSRASSTFFRPARKSVGKENGRAYLPTTTDLFLHTPSSLRASLWRPQHEVAETSCQCALNPGRCFRPAPLCGNPEHNGRNIVPFHTRQRTCLLRRLAPYCDKNNERGA